MPLRICNSVLDFLDLIHRNEMNLASGS
jgi:hypothetical protein